MLLISHISYLEDVAEAYCFVPWSYKYLRQYQRISRKLFFIECIFCIINVPFLTIFTLSYDLKPASSRRLHTLHGQTEQVPWLLVQISQLHPNQREGVFALAV